MTGGITFSALDVELTDVLAALDLEPATWRLRDVEAAGAPARAGELMRCSDSATALDGQTLARLAVDVQIIDGDFETIDADGQITRIRATDGRWWDIYSTRPDVLRAAADRFPDAEPIG